MKKRTKIKTELNNILQMMHFKWFNKMDASSIKNQKQFLWWIFKSFLCVWLYMIYNIIQLSGANWNYTISKLCFDLWTTTALALPSPNQHHHLVPTYLYISVTTYKSVIYEKSINYNDLLMILNNVYLYKKS